MKYSLGKSVPWIQNYDVPINDSTYQLKSLRAETPGLYQGNIRLYIENEHQVKYVLSIIFFIRSG
jgi:hypothetical protein